MSPKLSISAAIMPFCRKFTLYLLALALPACLWLAASAEDVSFERVNCPFQHPTAQCGVAHLPENRESGNSEVQVFIAILGAENNTTPAVILGGGGPGVDLYLNEPGYIDYWDNYRQQILGTQGRLILMDQRGSGFSRPRLNCPEEKPLAVESLEQLLPLEEEIEKSLIALHECLRRLRTDGIQVTAYTTAAAADDVEDIRRLLGIDQWHLIGFSYGTRLALEVMRRHPDGVASALLDSAFPYDSWQHGPPHAFAAAVEKISADCEQQPHCWRYGNVIANIEKAMYLADEAPLILHGIYNDTTYHIVLTPTRLLDLIHSGLYSRVGVEKLPLFSRQLAQGNINNQNAMYFAQIYLDNLLGDSFASMLFFATNCQEDPAETAEPNSELEYYDNHIIWLFLAACNSLWGVTPSPQPIVTSDKPVLLVSGVYDHATPPAWAHQLAKRLPNAQHIVIPASHSSAADIPCLQKATRTFFQSPTTAVSHFCDDETLIFD